jgi:predicted kinase
MKVTAPRLIHLNGPAGIGKDTIAKKYIDAHPFSLCIKTDEIITTLGQWSAGQNYDSARHLAFNLALSMISTHLKTGYDVIVPHLLTDTDEAQALEKNANHSRAVFIEILLITDKSDALDRVFERGTRGEPGAPPLTPDDRPEFEELYDNVLLTSKKRSGVVKVVSDRGDVDGTYQRVMDIVSSSTD